MASSRDDFIIAIRSAFLKKSTQQKFSLLTLVIISVSIIILSSLDFRVIRYIKIGINELVYRSSFIVSIPENLAKNTFTEIRDYSTFFIDFKKNREELNELRSKDISSEITQYENKELKELINDYISSSDKILAKIIVDHDSPFLKSIIINKGSKDNIKIGTNIYDQSYLVGRVIEVNYKSSRVLLLSDLNSNVPVTIAPQNVQAIITGRGDDFAEIKYVKQDLSSEFDDTSIVYTSGTGAIFKSGIPIGRVQVVDVDQSKKFKVQFYSDFSQLKYVFAEVVTKTEIDTNSAKESQEIQTPIEAKLQILDDELKIIEQSNTKFKNENESLKTEINELNNTINQFRDEILNQKKTIDQFNLDKEELQFLRLNLEYSHKCRKSFFNNKGFVVGTPEYKNCVLKRGRIND